MRLISFMIISLLFFSVPLQAKPTTIQQHSPATTHQQSVSEHRSFSVAERNLIRAHLIGRQPVSLQQGKARTPPGLREKIARGSSLPAGWQSKVRPGHILDYHVYRQGEYLPDSLLQRLSSTPSKIEIVRIDNKVVMFNAETHLILDAFDLNPSR